MQKSCAVTLLVITFLLITTMAALTPVTTENMETFNKRLSEERPVERPSSVGMRSAGLNQGPVMEEGPLIHTYPAMEEGPLIRRRASSLYQQDMQSKQASTADVKSLTHDASITGVVGILNCNHQDDIKDDINKTINKASSAVAATAPSNSTLSHASFIRKGREEEEEKTRSKNDNDNNNNNNNDHDIDKINMNNDDVIRFSTVVESSSSLTPMTTTTVNDCSQALEGVIEVMENMENSSKSTAKIGATSVASSPEGRCVKFFLFFFYLKNYLLFSTFSTTETCNFETH